MDNAKGILKNGTSSKKFPSEDWVDSWVKVINEDKDIARLGKWFNANVLFDFEEQKYIFSVNRGKVQEVIVNPIWDKPWNFAVRAPLKTWLPSIEDVPPPFYQDIFAMMWNHGMVLEGDVVNGMQNIRVLKLMMRAMKQV